MEVSVVLDSKPSALGYSALHFWVLPTKLAGEATDSLLSSPNSLSMRGTLYSVPSSPTASWGLNPVGEHYSSENKPLPVMSQSPFKLHSRDPAAPFMSRAVCPWTGHLTSLRLCFHNFKMQIVIYTLISDPKLLG